MTEKDAPEDAPAQPEGPSLELPSFGFRRTKKRREAAAPPRPPADVEPEPELEAEPQPEPAREPEPVARVEEPTPTPTHEPVPEPEPAPTTEVRPAAQREPEPVGAPRRLFVEEASSAAPEEPGSEEAAPEPRRRARRRPALPQLGAVPATLLTGLVVGLLTVGLVWASQGACEVVRGTSSCGDAGFLLLIAVLVVAGWVGGALLRALGVVEGGSTSFLAMGLVAVVLMLFLADQLFRWEMVLVVPAVAMVAYVLAHRVSTAMVEPGGREMHR